MPKRKRPLDDWIKLYPDLSPKKQKITKDNSPSSLEEVLF